MAIDQLATPTLDITAMPVFVDASGHRAKRVQQLGVLVVLLSMTYGVALAVAAATGVQIGGAIVPYPALGPTAQVKQTASVPGPPTLTETKSGPQSLGATPPTGASALQSKSRASAMVSRPVAPAARSAAPRVVASRAVVTPSRPVDSTTATSSPIPVPTASPSATPNRGNSSTAPVPVNRPTSLPTHSTTARRRGPVS